MENILFLFVCLLMGIALQLTGRLPANAPAALNGFIIHVSLPALVLLHLHKFPLDASIFFPIAAPWLLFLLGLTVVTVAAKAFKWSRETAGALILTSGLANTSFVGLPLIEVFYGAQFIGLGLIIDTLGTYLVLSTFGLLVAVICSLESGRLSGTAIIRKILLFPPFIALVFALALRAIELPSSLEAGLSKLGSTLAPLALVSVGLQLRLAAVRKVAHFLLFGLTYKLLVGPLLVSLFLSQIAQFKGTISQVTLFEMAMAPQIGAAIVAIEHKLNPDLVTLMVGIGIPLSLLTVPVWWYFMQGI